VCIVYGVLYSEIALSPKLFGIGHVYINNYLLRFTDTMAFQNVELSTCDIVHEYFDKAMIIVHLLV
jgi:hypothetical protein